MVRIGVIGIGNMGTGHVHSILGGKVKNLEVTAISDEVQANLDRFPQLKHFPNGEELIKSGLVDAVLIATPHYSHTTLGIAALEAGLHVLVEKPISVHKADCERLIAAYKPGGKQVFAAMFNQRTDPYYQRVRDLIKNGELGEIRRVNWIITNWFRTEAYYASGGWRATWAGEGGGVLLNQCPHNLDLFWWMFGTPKSVRAFCSLGRYHNIEVEDDVTAYIEFPNGATGVFITSTGEAPGTNRLEIAGERGKLVYENNVLAFTRNEVPMTEFSRTTKGGFTTPPIWEVNVPMNGNHGGQHIAIMQNFVEAIENGAELLSPAVEGIHSVELANAMLYSSFTEAPVQFPLDPAKYETFLKKKVSESKFVKKTVATAGQPSDFASSFR